MNNRTLIRRIARRFADCYRLSYDDLVQEGEIELNRAEETFRGVNGSSFDTFARACVVNRFRNIARSEKRRRGNITEHTIRSLWYKSEKEERLSDRYDLRQAERALSGSDRFFWFQYKMLEGRRGALSFIAARHGKTREWARRTKDRIFAILRRELEEQGAAR